MKTTRRALSILLSILTAAAGVAHQAAAQVIVGGAASGGTSGLTGGIPRIELNGGFTPLSPAASMSPSLAGGIPIAIPVLPVSALAPASVQTAQAVRLVDAAKVSFNAQTQLALAGDKLAASAAKGADQSFIINSFFTGAREFGGPAVVVAAPSVPTPDTLAASAPKGKATPPTPVVLDAMALDSKTKPKGPKPVDSLIGYGLRRVFLRYVAERWGIVLSLPQGGEQIARRALALASGKQAVISDYDDTLAAYRSAVPAGNAAAMGRITAAGKLMIVNTERPAMPMPKDVSLSESLSSVAPTDRAGVYGSGKKDGQIFKYEPDGTPRVIYKEPEFLDEEKAKIDAAITEFRAKLAGLGTEMHDGSQNIPAESHSGYSKAFMLKIGTSEEVLLKARDILQAELKTRGLPFEVEARFANSAKNPPYVVFSRMDKSWPLRPMMELFGLKAHDFVVVGDAMYYPKAKEYKGVKGVVARALTRLGLRLNGGIALGKTGNGTDRNMERAVPGALTLSVGGTADPSLRQGYVMPSKGPEVTQRILEAVGRAPDTDAEAAIGAKALKWMYVQDAIGISVFILTSIAYPMVVIPAVGVATFGVLMALGPLAAIALGPLSGMIATRFAPREGLAILAGLRVALTVTLPVMALTGLISFWPLLIASIANGWQLALLMTSRSAYTRRFAITDPKQTRSWLHIGNLTTIGFSIYFLLQVLFGSIGQIGGLIDAMDPMTPFWVSAAVNVGLVGLNYWKIPKIANFVSNGPSPTASGRGTSDRAIGEEMPLPKSVGKAASLYGSVVPFLKRFWKRFWREVALLAASVGVYLWGLPLALPVIGTGLGSPLWIAGALVYGLSRTDTYKSVMATPKIRNALLLSALAAGLIYPFQSFAMPLIAAALGAKALIYGQLLGALSFGQLFSNVSMARLPEVSIPLINKTAAAERLLQAGVLALAAIWAGWRLFPGSILAAAAAVAIGMAVIAVTSRLSDRGWIRFYGVGLMAAIGVALSWGFYPGIFASVMLLGLFTGSFMSAITAYISGNSDPKMVAQTFGVSSALINALMSFGFGLMAASTKAYGDPAFPGALTPIIAVYLAAAVLFFFAPRWLPGLPEKILLSPEPKKTAV